MAFSLGTKPDLDVPHQAAELESAGVEESLAWAWEEFGESAAIGTSFQGSGLVILHHAKSAGLDLPAFTVDTGLLFPETLELKERLEDFFGIEIEGLHPEQTVDEQWKAYGGDLWKTHPDTCCTLRKVLPLQRKLAELSLWITGVRRGQSTERQGTQVLEMYLFDRLRDHHILKLNPMAAWSRDDVWDYIRRYKIPYNPLHDRGYRSLGCWPCTRAAGTGSEPENERAGRWEGFDKTECGIHTFLGENI